MRRRRSLLMLASMLLAAGASAQAPTPYFERVLADALPGARILALAEDPRGAIWVGTSNGLGRIVGDQVRIWRQSSTDTASLPANEVRSIDASDSTRVWVGTLRGLCSIDPISGLVERHPLRIEGAAPNAPAEVWQLARGEGGVLWVAWDQGLACYDAVKRRWWWPKVEERRYPGERLRAVPHALAWDPQRRVLWAGTKGGLYRIPGAVAHAPAATERLDPYRIGTHVSCLSLDASGRVWMNDAERWAISVLDPRSDELSQLELPPGMDGGSMNRALLADAQGGIWLAGNDDVLYWRGPGAAAWVPLTFDARFRWSPESSSVNALMQASTGVVWVGTEEGLLRVVPEHAAQELVAGWDSPRKITRMRAYAGQLFLATNGMGILQYDRSALGFTGTVAAAHGPTNRPGLMSDMVNDFAIKDGRFVLGTKAGLRYWPEPERPDVPGIMPPDSRPRYKHVMRVEVDEQGTTWVLTYHHGLWRQAAHDAEPVQLPVPEGVGRVLAMALHPQGGMVCGTATGRCFRLDAAGGLLSMDAEARHAAAVSALAVDAEGRSWVGFDDGWLARSTASTAGARAWDERSGLPTGAVRDIVPLKGGGACVLTDAGVAWIDASGAVQHVPLLGHWGRSMAILVDADGSLVLGCSKAIVRVRREPDRAAEEIRPAIAAVIGAGEHLPVHPFLSSLEVPYERRSLSLRVSSLGAAIPERVLLRYRLNPDLPWVELGTGRSIDLPELREGVYRIEVALLSAASPTAVLRLTIRPPWFRSWSFILAAAALFTLSIAFALRAWLRGKLRAEQERSAREKALLEERIRIAHDLHDDLGSGLAMIAMEGELARMDDRADPRDALRRMSEGTRDITDSMRRIVWALGSGQETLGDLAAYLRSSAADLMDRAEVRFRSEARIAQPNRRLTADQRRHLLLITKELLLNVVKHAQANNVRLALEEKGDELLIAVSDDGRGFDAQERMGTGTGTLSIAKRAEALGGTWSVQSAKGEGTVAEVRVPLFNGPV